MKKNVAAANAPLAAMRTSSAVASFGEHVSELRRTLIYSFLVIALGIGLCLFFYQEIFALVTQPLSPSGPLQKIELKRERLLNSGEQELIYSLSSKDTAYPSADVRLVGERSYAIPPGAFLDIETPVSTALLLFSPTEGMLTAFKMSFWLGLLLSSPFWGCLFFKFVLPALYPQERRLIYFFFGGTLLALFAGFCVAYYFTIPFANQYLEAFNATIGRNNWSLAQYLDYTLMLMVANGFVFEIGLLLFFLVHVGVLTSVWMVGKRRHMIVLAFILGAFLTPPDVPTQLMVAIPLMALYELAIFYAKLRNTNVD